MWIVQTDFYQISLLNFIRINSEVLEKEENFKKVMLWSDQYVV